MVERNVADMEGHAAVGDMDAAATAKVQAATQACSALTRLCDDDRFFEALEIMRAEVSEHRASVLSVVDGQMAGSAPGDSDVPKPQNWFRTVEVQLLELSGLTRQLAERHTDAAIAAFQNDSQPALTRLVNPMSFLGDVRSLRDSVCESAELLSASVRREQSRRRWKRFVTLGLGGALLVSVNAAGAALLGPAGVAASGAVGSAAVGAALSKVL